MKVGVGITNMAEEMHNPVKDLPQAIIIGLGIITVCISWCKFSNY